MLPPYNSKLKYNLPITPPTVSLPLVANHAYVRPYE